MSEEALQERIKELEKELKDIKGKSVQYLQNVAHQLTAPLNAIKWSIEALKDKDVPVARKQKLLSSVYSQATILVHLIKNFTLMSDLDVDHDLRKFRETPQDVNILRLAINLANDFQPQALDSKKKVIVDTDSFDEVVGKKNIFVEKNLVAQSISNILENAVKYGDANSTIEIEAAKGDKVICIAITSTGIPIEEQDAARVFDRGHRGKMAIDKVPAGTGFGLYLVRRIMELHKGFVTVETDGKRSTFKVCFPENLFK